MGKLTEQKLPDLPVIHRDMVDRLADHANHLAARRTAEMARHRGRHATSARSLLQSGASAWRLKPFWLKKLNRL